MGVLQDFERRLEGAVEGAFARIFRSGLQPVELAKGLQRYARDTQHVSHDGVVVPNAYRFTVNAKDLDRLQRLGVDLGRELAGVVSGTARERGWVLRGPAIVKVESGSVPLGRYDLVGRVEAIEQRGDEPPADRRGGDGGGTAVLPQLDPGATGPPRARAGASIRVLTGGAPTDVELDGRTVAGRAPTTDIVLQDSTVSREHAAFVHLGSMNGTKVNGRSAGEHELEDGDTIELGEAVLEFREH